MKKPNLLFIFADQMRACDWHEGCLQTPHLDRLAREGANVPLCFCNSPVCTPSRATLLTGLLPPRSRVPGNDLPLPGDTPTIGDFLKAAGYRTGYVGKWHLDGVPRDKWTPPGPRRHGFDFWAAYNCTHDYAHPKYFRDTPELIEAPGYEPQVQTDVALEFLAQDDERPFALFLSWGPPHDPYPLVPDEFRDLYGDVTLRGNAVPEVANPLARGLDSRETLRNYYAAISALDAQLGRLLAFLDEGGLATDTIVIFTSDHGDMLWSHGLMKKQLPYEEALRVPFVIRWPGQIPDASQPDILLSVSDFTPTILGLLNIESKAHFDGADLSAALRGQPCDSPGAVLLMEMVTTDEGLRQNVAPWRGVRTKTHTYARHADGAPWLLFDNLADPLQRNNLIGDKNAACLQGELDELLGLLLRRAGDESLPWDETLRRLDLVTLWNEREKALHGERGRFLVA
jgi:arylsulfatase A-like enzyme